MKLNQWQLIGMIQVSNTMSVVFVTSYRGRIHLLLWIQLFVMYVPSRKHQTKIQTRERYKSLLLFLM